MSGQRRGSGDLSAASSGCWVWIWKHHLVPQVQAGASCASDGAAGLRAGRCLRGLVGLRARARPCPESSALEIKGSYVAGMPSATCTPGQQSREECEESDQMGTVSTQGPSPA